jgi:uncharacterized protein
VTSDLVLQLLPVAAVMLVTGVVGGILAGLLGVGGGIVIVPVLEIALGVLGVDAALRMHVAVATSLATIIPTAISSSRAHHARGAVDSALVRRWGLMLLVGSAVGSLLASQVHSSTLAAVFGVVALLVAVKMLLPLDGFTLARDVPRHPAAQLLPLSIGGLSSMMGIGGGTLSVPILTLLGQSVHRAVGTASLFGLLIGVPATLVYAFAGTAQANLPAGNIGYISVPGFALIAPATVFAAPWGARLAHRLSKQRLGQLFGAFLLLVACRMLYRGFG